MVTTVAGSAHASGFSAGASRGGASTSSAMGARSATDGNPFTRPLYHDGVATPIKGGVPHDWNHAAACDE